MPTHVGIDERAFAEPQGRGADRSFEACNAGMLALQDRLQQLDHRDIGDLTGECSSRVLAHGLPLAPRGAAESAPPRPCARITDYMSQRTGCCQTQLRPFG